MPASLLKTMAEVESDFDSQQSIMQLDDNCVVDRKGSARLRCLVKEEAMTLAGKINH